MGLRRREMQFKVYHGSSLNLHAMMDYAASGKNRPKKKASAPETESTRDIYRGIKRASTNYNGISSCLFRLFFVLLLSSLRKVYYVHLGAHIVGRGTPCTFIVYVIVAIVAALPRRAAYRYSFYSSFFPRFFLALHRRLLKT